MTDDGPVVAPDVGGTAMKGALLDDQDRDLDFHRWSTPRTDGPDAVVAAALDAVAELLQHADDAVAVGLVVPGLVDDRAGIALYSENIRWTDVPFRQLVSDRSGLPVGFGHDVRAGGLAERIMGAAQGCDDVLFMPIGTGISGAMYVAGRLIENKHAGEIELLSNTDGTAYLPPARRNLQPSRTAGFRVIRSLRLGHLPNDFVTSADEEDRHTHK